MIKWKEIVGFEWYSILHPFLEGEEMKNIIKSIKSERKRYIVYPEQKQFYKMFRVFKDLQPSDIKLIMLGQD